MMYSHFVMHATLTPRAVTADPAALPAVASTVGLTPRCSTRPAEPPDVVLRYGDHADALIDVFLPTSIGRPERPVALLVLVHGGFWRQCVRPLARAPACPRASASRVRCGVSEYRRTGRPGWLAGDRRRRRGGARRRSQGCSKRWRPASSTRRRHVWSPATPPAATSRLWAGLRAAKAARIASIVALAPVSDLFYAARMHMGDGAVQALLGGDPQARPHQYAQADVISLLPPTEVDVTIIQGDADKQVTVDMNRRLAARFHRAQPSATSSSPGSTTSRSSTRCPRCSRPPCSPPCNNRKTRVPGSRDQGSGQPRTRIFGVCVGRVPKDSVGQCSPTRWRAKVPTAVPPLAGDDEPDPWLGCPGGATVTGPEDPPPELVDEELRDHRHLVLEARDGLSSGVQRRSRGHTDYRIGGNGLQLSDAERTGRRVHDGLDDDHELVLLRMATPMRCAAEEAPDVGALPSPLVCNTIRLVPSGRVVRVHVPVG